MSIIINRERKDRLFKAIFEKKEYALSLYNALNNTNYINPEKLELYTIADTIYMGMKNDVSFIFHNELCLWEQQSTYNPNMPVRELLYIARQYEKYITASGMSVYGSKLIKLPVPRCIVFYNGRTEKPEQEIMKLSDAFNCDKEGSIEVTVKMININCGKNKKLMEHCKALNDYSRFYGFIEEERRRGRPIEDCVENAVNQAIRLNLLDGYFLKHRAEVLGMILTEYNEAQHLEEERNIGREEGRAEGRAEGMEEEKANNILAAIRAGISAEKIMEIFQINGEKYRHYEKMI